ncbi:MAG: hypothetical protein ACI4UE_01295 [Candidatus Scatovivens sp.]
MYNKLNKACAFYASYEHLVTMLISYIYGTKNNEKEIVTIFEKDLKDISDKILKNMKINTKEYKKINWNKTNINDLNIKLNKKLEDKIIIVCGDNKFIRNVNMILENFDENFELINCFSIFKNEKKIQEIIKDYSKVLTTQGIEEIKKIITCNI